MEQAPRRPVVAVATALGTIRVEIHVDTAPTTAAYVLDLVRRSVYDGSSFYRSTTLGGDREPLIQGGPWSDFICGIADAGPKIALLEDFETTVDSGQRHVTGAVSLARDLARTGHALAEWFICLDDYPDLDFNGPTDPDNRGFPVFGTVIDGLDIVAEIAAKPTGAPTTIDRLIGEVLVEPIAIRTVTLDAQAQPPMTTA